MKRTIFSVAILLLAVSSVSVAQIPNAGFEQWSGGQPVSWLTNNIPGIAVPVTQSSTARTGTSALRGQVVSYSGFSWTPLVESGTGGAGFPVTQRYAAVTGYYQFSPISGDRLNVSVLMTRNGEGIGAGGIFIENAASTYTAFNAPITYVTADVPDTCYIYFIIVGPEASDDSMHVNSSMLIDDLAFSAPVAVQQIEHAIPEQFVLQQNYPNPFNPITHFEFGIAQFGFVSLKVFDLLGTEVATVLSEYLYPGTYKTPWDASRLPSGVYFYRLESGGIVQSRKLLLLK